MKGSLEGILRYQPLPPHPHLVFLLKIKPQYTAEGSLKIRILLPQSLEQHYRGAYHYTKFFYFSFQVDYCWCFVPIMENRLT